MGKDIIVWLALVVVFAIIEGATAQLLTVWFAIGSLVALIAATLYAPLWLQITLFVIVSVLVLVFLRPFVKKLLLPVKSATNADMAIGKMVKVTEEIDDIKATGEVKVGGLRWSARSEDGRNIPIGATVEVLRIEGVKLYVRPVLATENDDKSDKKKVEVN